MSVQQPHQGLWTEETDRAGRQHPCAANLVNYGAAAALRQVCPALKCMLFTTARLLIAFGLKSVN